MEYLTIFYKVIVTKTRGLMVQKRPVDAKSNQRNKICYSSWQHSV